MREGVPAIVDVPQPIFIPESPHSVGKDKPVVAEPPATLHEFNKCRGSVHHPSHANPSFHLSLCPVQLFGKSLNLFIV